MLASSETSLQSALSALCDYAELEVAKQSEYFVTPSKKKRRQKTNATLPASSPLSLLLDACTQSSTAPEIMSIESTKSTKKPKSSPFIENENKDPVSMTALLLTPLTNIQDKPLLQERTFFVSARQALDQHMKRALGTHIYKPNIPLYAMKQTLLPFTSNSSPNSQSESSENQNPQSFTQSVFDMAQQVFMQMTCSEITSMPSIERKTFPLLFGARRPQIEYKVSSTSRRHTTRINVLPMMDGMLVRTRRRYVHKRTLEREAAAAAAKAIQENKS